MSEAKTDMPMPAPPGLWHLGEKTETREFCDRSVTRMEERQPDNPRLIRERQEAAELLGIEP
jgi:hypothetical protein